LIGEHTDYNQGFVLPAAIGFSCWVAIGLRDDRKLVLYSENFDQSVEVSLDDSDVRATCKWSDYPVGVARTLQQAGYPLHGANLYIVGDVPLGAGLSSSAAVEVSTAFALMDAAKHSIDLNRLAVLCQRAENEFVGARCGIMDQFVSCRGRAGNALLLDCRSLDFQLLRLPPQIRLVICNTMVQHKHEASGYNVRRAQCEEGVRELSKVYPQMQALRDISLSDLESHRNLLSDVVYKRCHHIVTENARTLVFASALQSGDATCLRQLMADSHRSLRDNFEVSCKELDIMVQLAEQQPGVLGARMTGGGFGGCTINLVRESESDAFCKRVAQGYEIATGHHPNIHVCEASQGVEMVRLGEIETSVAPR
jgi:galactokinase